MIGTVYTSRLGAGLGLIDETDSLLQLWSPKMTSLDLYKAALQAGAFPGMSARRLKNVVGEGFGARYLVNNAEPAVLLKELRLILPSADIRQLLLIYTARVHGILSDFVKQVYWSAYASGKSELQRSDSLYFVERANQSGKTQSHWSVSTIRRVASYLIGCCIDFGLLESTNTKTSLRIVARKPSTAIATVLSYQLHFSGLGDNSVVNHPDWELFGLTGFDVIGIMQTLARNGHLIVQAAGGITSISWKYKTIDEVIDAIRE